MRTTTSAFRFFVLVLVSLPLTSAVHAAAEKKLQKLTLMQLNDVYQVAGVEGGKRGGLARVATLVKKIRREEGQAAFLVAGDFISPSVASKLFQGEQMIAALNSAGVDYVTFGNHEFDLGVPVLLERMKQSKFKWIVSNVRNTSSQKPFEGVETTRVLQLNGVKVGVFGLLTTRSKTLSKISDSVQIEDPVRVARRAVKTLKAQGAQVIVGLTHLDMEDDQAVARVPGVNLIMGGHEHEILHSVVGQTLIAKVGSDARHLGKIDLYWDPQAKKVDHIGWELLPVDGAVSEDPETHAVVESYEKKLNERLSEKVAESTVELNATLDSRRQETNLGNLLTDIFRQQTGADIAIMNGGGIRSELRYGPGVITKKHIVSILPFDNFLVMGEVRGDVLQRVLEKGLQAYPQSQGSFLHVSGLKIKFDPKRPPGNRILEVTVGEQKLDLQRVYRVATNHYLMEGGDGLSELKGSKMILGKENARMLSDVVLDALTRMKTLSPQVEGRLQAIQ